ncbi:MAG: DM13 domain-containing protein [Candidatus Dormibacteria bacterium]
MRGHPLITAVAMAAVGGVAFVIVYFDPEALFTVHRVDEGQPATMATPVNSTAAAATPRASATSPAVIASGRFRDLEHATVGTASVLRLGDGSFVVRLEGFSTSDGPDVHVTLSPVPPTAGQNDFTAYLDLGSLKGNQGNQNYPVPAGTDIARYRSVVIWCRRFAVGFGVAPI